MLAPGADSFGEARIMDRLGQVRRYVDIGRKRGLEIGPLVSPIVTPDLGAIYYADHLATAELRQKYVDVPSIDEHRITPVDFVWGELTLAESTAAVAPFDYVVASHVIEHVPDIVGWLREIADVLAPGGRLCLVIPDRRLTFDVRRRPSDLSEVVEAYLLRLRRPSLRATFDYFSRSLEVDTAALWHGRPAYPDNATANISQGWDCASRAARTGDYIDTHCWVFSDAEFVQLIGDLVRMSLVDFRFVGFAGALVGDLEFFAVLERLDSNLSSADKISVALASLPGPDDMATVPLPSHSRGSEPYDPLEVWGDTLSKREIAIIIGKRSVMARARNLAGRLRSR
jgi:SAM-dependent methyltransferase